MESRQFCDQLRCRRRRDACNVAATAGGGGGRSDSFYLLAPDETRPPSGEKTAAAGSGWPISGFLVPMSTRALGSRSFAWLGLASFLPSSLRRAALFHSLNYRIDHSRSPRGRPSRSSRESGTADCLTRRPVVRLHMTQPPQSLLRRGRFYGSLPLARRECPPPIATTPDSRYQRRSAPLSSTPSVTPMSREGGLWESQHAVSAKLSIAQLYNYDGTCKMHYSYTVSMIILSSFIIILSLFLSCLIIVNKTTKKIAIVHRNNVAPYTHWSLVLRATRSHYNTFQFF